LALPVTDLTHLDLDASGGEARRLARIGGCRRRSTWQDGPLLRAQLLRLAAQDHVLLLTTHHICFDGWSRSEFWCANFATSTRAGFVLGGCRPNCPSCRSSTGILPSGSRNISAANTWLASWAYWKQQLKDLPLSIEIPTDRPRPAVQTFNGISLPFALPRTALEQVKLASQREGVTPYMTMLAAFQALVARYTGQDDIVLGTPTANRNRPELEG
jgi:hypothetical protein